MEVYLPWQFKKFNLSKSLMVNFNTAINGSVPASSIPVWYVDATTKNSASSGRLKTGLTAICHLLAETLNQIPYVKVHGKKNCSDVKTFSGASIQIKETLLFLKPGT